MFGYVIANDESLDEAEKSRWHSAYCGLCRTIGKRCGRHCRLTLTFDMTFLALLLQSLYEPAEHEGHARCALHPAKPQPYEMSEAMDYAADVGILLAYHKCLDDWNDERKLSGRVSAAALHGAYAKAASRQPRVALAVAQGDDRQSFARGAGESVWGVVGRGIHMARRYVGGRPSPTGRMAWQVRLYDGCRGRLRRRCEGWHVQPSGASGNLT